MGSYADSLVNKATEFFAHGKTVFAMCGEGVCCHVADCTDETGAKTVAEILEKQRTALAIQGGLTVE